MRSFVGFVLWCIITGIVVTVLIPLFAIPIFGQVSMGVVGFVIYRLIRGIGAEVWPEKK